MAIYWAPDDDEPPRMTPEAVLSSVGGKRDPGPSTDVRVTHVPLGTLIDYVRGLGSAAVRGSVAYHLCACVRCASMAARLTRLTAFARADVDTAPPDDVVGAAIALFNRLRTGGRGPSASRDLPSTASPKLPA